MGMHTDQFWVIDFPSSFNLCNFGTRKLGNRRVCEREKECEGLMRLQMARLWDPLQGSMEGNRTSEIQ